MRVEVLGTRGHIEASAPGHSLHAGILIDDVLFDLGEREYLERRPRAVFLTHLHEDHAFFVNDGETVIDPPLYGPESFSQRDVRVIRTTVEVNGMLITPVPTNHSQKVRSCGYLVEKDLTRVLYTGDLFSVQGRYRDRLPEVDLVITDGSFIRRGGLVRPDPQTGRPHGHAGIPDLVNFFAPLTNRIIITHLGSWFFKDIPAGVRQVEALSSTTEVCVADDGMVIDIAFASL
jgi:ribonuclease BN (tRNA processing enzyme)